MQKNILPDEREYYVFSKYLALLALHDALFGKCGNKKENKRKIIGVELSSSWVCGHKIYGLRSSSLCLLDF